MIASGTCTLISIDENNNPRARAMDAFIPDENFIVWFGTKGNSRKVEQIRKNPIVTLYYLDEDKSGYVSLLGKAEIIDDVEAKKLKWKTAWNDFYKIDKSDYLLIKVKPIWLEVLSPKRGINNNPINWLPPKIDF